MLAFSNGLNIYVALEPCDLRKGFHGLHALALGELKGKVDERSIFVFGNRARTLVKILAFDGTGLWVCAKRLEKGRFSWPRGDGKRLRLAPEALQWLLGGVELREGKLLPWYGRGDDESAP